MSAPKARLPLFHAATPRSTPTLAAPSERTAARPLLCVRGEAAAAQAFARAFAQAARAAGLPLVALVGDAHTTSAGALRECGIDPVESIDAIGATEDALATWLQTLPASARVLAVGDLLPSLVRPTYTVALGRSALGGRVQPDLWLPRAVPSVASALAEIWAAKRVA